MKYINFSISYGIMTLESQKLQLKMILSDGNMRKMRKKCHHLFDSFWHTSKERNQCYQRLAMALDIDITFCHFGYFDQEQLEKAYQVMLAWKK